ncbi:hypothetical protein SKC41_30755 [Mycobacterium sp. 050128]|uniref:hypothetical protein n=1 Tax=Mycobacterium sp. 050128 TaxID=3096112 RepID=UPI002EDB91F0
MTSSARAVAAAVAPLAKSPAGAQLLMAAMDQHLQAMQGQLHTTKTQNQTVSATLRQVATGYQTLSTSASTSPGTALPLFSGGKIGSDPGPLPTGIVWCRDREGGGFTCRELLPDGTISIFTSPTDISGHWPD